MSKPSPPPSSFSLSERLAALPYFRALNDSELDTLAANATVRRLHAGEMVFQQGAMGKGLWLIETGQVKIVRTRPDGREHILLLTGPGDSFNEIPALDQGAAAASAVALSDVIAWCIPSEVLRALLAANPALALDVLDTLTQRMRTLIDQIEDLALCSVTTRLARFLLKQADGEKPNNGDLTRTVIAAHLATTPETLSRSLRTLEGLGAIQADRTDIVVLRRNVLEVVAAG